MLRKVGFFFPVEKMNLSVPVVEGSGGWKIPVLALPAGLASVWQQRPDALTVPVPVGCFWRLIPTTWISSAKVTSYAKTDRHSNLLNKTTWSFRAVRTTSAGTPFSPRYVWATVRCGGARGSPTHPYLWNLFGGESRGLWRDKAAW